LRYVNVNDVIEAPLFTTLEMSTTVARNNNAYSYRFFIEGCDMVWCYSLAVDRTDTNAIASYQLEAGQWEIRATMNVQNLLLVSPYTRMAVINLHGKP